MASDIAKNQIPEELLKDPGFAGDQAREQSELDAADGLLASPTPSTEGFATKPKPDIEPAPNPNPTPKDPPLPDSPKDPKPPLITDPDPPGDIKW